MYTASLALASRSPWRRRADRRARTDRLPQPFDQHVVAPIALAIHADRNGMPLERADELAAGKLAALVGVHERR